MALCFGLTLQHGIVPNVLSACCAPISADWEGCLAVVFQAQVEGASFVDFRCFKRCQGRRVASRLGGSVGHSIEAECHESDVRL